MADNRRWVRCWVAALCLGGAWPASAQGSAAAAPEWACLVQPGDTLVALFVLRLRSAGPDGEAGAFGALHWVVLPPPAPAAVAAGRLWS